MIQYVLNQKEHHAHKTYPDEFLMFLEENEVEYDPKYLDLQEIKYAPFVVVVVETGGVAYTTVFEIFLYGYLIS